MAEKIYYLSDLEKLQGIAKEMGLKAWKLENLSGAELQKPNPAIRPNEALEKIFSYIKSEVIPDGKYKLIGKTGHRSIHRTEIFIQKGQDIGNGGGSSFAGAMAISDYSEVIKENAKLKADNYFLTIQVNGLNETIADLKAELEMDDDDDDESTGNNVYIDMAKEYAPQLINIVTQYLTPKPPPVPVSFADPAPAPAAQKVIRFTEAYNNFWRACKDQEAVTREFNYLQTNRPDKLQDFTNLFNNESE